MFVIGKILGEIGIIFWWNRGEM